MKDKEKTKEQLLSENQSLRRELAVLKASEKECRWVEAALRESEERYRRLVDSITDYIYTVKVENGRPISTTHGPGCLAVTGYTSGYFQIHPHLWYEMIHEEDREEVLKQIGKVLSGGTVQPIEHRILHKDGSIRWIRNTTVPHYDKDGKLISYDGLISDITERKRAEEQLRTIFDNTTDGILLADIESKRFYMGNKRIREMLGYSPDEIKALGVMDIHPEKDLPYVIDQFARQAMKEFTIAKDIPVKRKDGSVFYADINSSPVTLGGKRYLLGIFRDITERKKAEEALERAKKEWEATFDGITAPLFIHDSEFRVVRANLAYRDAAGMKFKEFIGKPYYEVFPKMDGPFKMCLKAQELQQEEEFSCPLTNRIFRVRFYPIKDVSGGYLYSIHILEDITDMKRTEEELRLRAQLLDSTSDTIFLLDLNGKFVYFNKAAWKSRGYTRDELMVMNLHVLDTPEYEKIIETRFRELMEKGQCIFESAHRCKDGSIMPVEISARLIETGGRKLALSVIRDITERKKAQRRIKEETEITSHLLMIAKATAHTTDIDKLMEQVVHCSHKIVKCDICRSYLWDGEARVFRPTQAFGLSHNLYTSV